MGWCYLSLPYFYKRCKTKLFCSECDRFALQYFLIPRVFKTDFNQCLLFDILESKNMCRARNLCQTFSICHPGEKLASVWADLTLDIKEIGWLPIPRFPCSFVFSSSSQSLQGTGNSSGACVTVNNMPAWSCDQEMAKICLSLTNRSFCRCMLWTTKPASSSLQWAQLRRYSGDPCWWKAWRNQRGKDCITLHCKAAMSLTRVGLFSLKIYHISLPKCELWLFPVVFSKHMF